MVFRIESTNQIVSGVAVEMFHEGTDYWLPAGVTDASSGAQAIFAISAGLTIIIDGSVIGATDGIEYDNFGLVLSVGSRGEVRSISGLAAGDAVLDIAGAAQINNHGHIESSSGNGINLAGGNNVVTNFGIISGALNGLWIGQVGSVSNTVLNHGSISGGVHGSLARDVNGVLILGTATTLFNDGTITAVADGGAAIALGALSEGGGNFATITNQGSLVSLHGFGVDGSGAALGFLTLTNTGLISGGIRGTAGDDLISNSGTILGNVTIAEGADTFNNHGTVTGTVALGASDDRYDGRGGSVTDVVYGEDGMDTLLGGASDDLLSGDAGNDRLRGLAGDDSLSGGLGNDWLAGGLGDDTLSAGAGRDTMTGGAGEDVFVFASAAEAGRSLATRDQISDFTTKVDDIDLSAIKAGQIFIGSGTFATSGAAQVHYIAATGLLEGDTNGNGVADYAVFLHVGTVLAANDLIL